MSLKVELSNPLKTPSSLVSIPLHKDILLQIFQLNSLIDLKACRLVCKEWTLLSGSVIFTKVLNTKYQQWIQTTLVKIESIKNKCAISTESAKLAKFVDDKTQALKLLERSLTVADKIGVSYEYWEGDDGSKPGEYDGDRIACYLKIIQAYTYLGKSNEILDLMKKSKRAKIIAEDDLKETGLQIYADLAKIFAPIGKIEEVIALVKNDFLTIFGKPLFARAIKTYLKEEQSHQPFLNELNTIWKEYLKNQNWFDYPSSYRRKLECLQVIKGYCYLGHMNKAIKILQNFEEHNRSENRVKTEWLSKAYTIIAMTFASQGQIQKTREFGAKILDDRMSFMKEILNAKAYVQAKERDNALKSLRLAEVETYNSLFSDRLKAYLELAEGYFHVDKFPLALLYLRKAEQKAKEDKYHESEALLKLIKAAKSLMLSNSSKELGS